MAPFASLHTWAGNPRIVPALAAAKLNGLEIELPEFKYGVNNKDPVWVAKFPLAKVPALETTGNHPQFVVESAAIALFLADSGPFREQLLGATPEQRAKINQWIFHGELEMVPHILTGLKHSRKLVPFSQENEDAAQKGIDRIAAVLEEQLEKHQWIAETEKFSIADLIVAATFDMGLKSWLKKEWRDAHPKIVAWYTKVTEIEALEGIFGEQKFTEE
ncbi:glutathione S-transferase [Tricharina praecox]|uniref:glutathione S-transferase n=1 Tax=Tricharina praecox TaxID=43433 RepID=UPI00221F0FFC|nr:glutathione S-transferase [Tricharina praecox]KAI5843139.1 glutathione S-transferase [Tricharina praecox]